MIWRRWRKRDEKRIRKWLKERMSEQDFLFLPHSSFSVLILSFISPTIFSLITFFFLFFFPLFYFSFYFYFLFLSSFFFLLPSLFLFFSFFFLQSMSPVPLDWQLSFCLLHRYLFQAKNSIILFCTWFFYFNYYFFIAILRFRSI